MSNANLPWTLTTANVRNGQFQLIFIDFSKKNFLFDLNRICFLDASTLQLTCFHCTIQWKSSSTSKEEEDTLGWCLYKIKGKILSLRCYLRRVPQRDVAVSFPATTICRCPLCRGTRKLPNESLINNKNTLKLISSWWALGKHDGSTRVSLSPELKINGNPCCLLWELKTRAALTRIHFFPRWPL